MNRHKRQHELLKLAAKKKSTGLFGKFSRKDLEKHLANSKKDYHEQQTKLNAAKKEFDKLEKLIAETSESLKGSKEDILFCHDVLRNMDFAQASDVRLGKSRDDVAYAVDKKWMHYAEDELVPYNQWRAGATGANKAPGEVEMEVDEKIEEPGDNFNFDGFDI